MLASRWLIRAVIFVARLALGFQFQSAGSVAPFLIDEYGIDYSQIGILVGLYMLPGLVLAVPGGFIGKRFGDKRIVLVGLVLMIAGGVILGEAESYAAVVAGRLVSGAGAAFLFVLMTKMVADWFVGKELFVGMSIFIVGWPVGIAAGQALQGPIAEQASTGLVFHLTALATAVALAVVAAFYRPPPAQDDIAGPSSGGLSKTEIWLVCVAGLMWMLINGAYLVVLSFGPTLLREQGASIADAGFAVSLMSWVFIFAVPLGGYLATRWRAPNAIMIAGLAGGAVAAVLIPFGTAPYLTFAAFGVGVASAAPAMAAIPAEVLRPENRGPGLGVYYLWYYGGSAFLPGVGGYLKDVTGSATASVLFGAAMMLGTLCLLGLMRFEQRRLGRTQAAGHPGE